MRKKRTKIPVSVSAAQARSSLGEIIRRASATKPERFLIGLRGKPKVVVMGLDDYRSLIAPSPRALAELRSISKSNGSDELTMGEIDAEIAAYRKERAANAGSVSRS